MDDVNKILVSLSSPLPISFLFTISLKDYKIPDNQISFIILSIEVSSPTILLNCLMKY